MAIPFDPRNRDRYGAPSPPRRRRTTSMSAGQVLIVGFICFLAASLLNAQSLHDWATRQAFDSRIRRPALTATDALVWIAEHTGLAKPRQAVDDALGRTSEGGNGQFTVDPPTTTGEATKPAAGGEASGAPPTTAAPTGTAYQPHVPTKDAKLRLYIAGDSQAQGFGESLERLAGATGVIDPTLDFKVSSGLTRPDFFDWPKRLQAQVNKLDPDVVVVDFGGNDAQDIKADDGKTYPVTDPKWAEEYGKRVGAVMDFLSAGGRKVIWVGTPNARDDSFTQRLSVLRDTVQRQVAAHPDVVFVDTWAMFASPTGGYADYVVDDDGEAKPMRQNDGFHLNLDGANKLARAIEAKVEAQVVALGGSVSH